MFLLLGMSDDASKSSLGVIKIRFLWLWCWQMQGKSSNAGVPAEGVIPEATERRGIHVAHMELVIQQVWVPRQTLTTRDRGACHPSVIRALAVVALRVQFCRHTPEHNNHKPFWRATTKRRWQISSLCSEIKLEQAFNKYLWRCTKDKILNRWTQL